MWPRQESPFHRGVLISRRAARLLGRVSQSSHDSAIPHELHWAGRDVISLTLPPSGSILPSRLSEIVHWTEVREELDSSPAYSWGPVATVALKCLHSFCRQLGHLLLHTGAWTYSSSQPICDQCNGSRDRKLHCARWQYTGNLMQAEPIGPFFEDTELKGWGKKMVKERQTQTEPGTKWHTCAHMHTHTHIQYTQPLSLVWVPSSLPEADKAHLAVMGVEDSYYPCLQPHWFFPGRILKYAYHQVPWRVISQQHIEKIREILANFKENTVNCHWHSLLGCISKPWA